jgi:hypothetical protein
MISMPELIGEFAGTCPPGLEPFLYMACVTVGIFVFITLVLLIVNLPNVLAH